MRTVQIAYRPNELPVIVAVHGNFTVADLMNIEDIHDERPSELNEAPYVLATFEVNEDLSIKLVQIDDTCLWP